MDTNQLINSLRRYTTRLKQELESYVLNDEIEGPREIEKSKIITINDAARVNAKNVVVDINPKQNLHGYDHPWVGGAGKNKLPMTVEGIKAANTSGTWDGNSYTLNGITFTILTDSYGNVTGIKANGTASSEILFHLLIGALAYNEMILNGCPSGGSALTYKLSAQLNQSPWTTDNDFGSGTPITIPNSNEIHVYINIKSNIQISNLTFYPMIRLATETDSTFEPYTNICPISGFDSVSVQRCGKNLAYNIMIENVEMNGVTWRKNDDGSITVSGTPTDNSYIYAIQVTVKSSITGIVTISGLSNVNNVILEYVLLEDRNGNRLAAYSYNDQSDHTIDLTQYTNVYFINLVYKRRDNNVACSGTITPQLELGSTATTYEPYQGKTYAIHLGETVYGGTLDVTKGELRVTKEITDLGNLSWGDTTVDSNACFSARISGKTYSTNAICSCYPYYFRCDIDKSFSTAIGDANQIYIRDSSYTSTTDFKTAVTGQTLVYELATPYTIKLTPQQIKLLENNNTIYADSGDISIEYQPNNTIGKVIATIEDEYDPKPEVVDQYTNVFGFVEDMDVLSTSGRITYIGTNENYTPITVDLSTGHYMLNDWAEFPFLTENKPYMVRPDGTPDYQLNEYDYTKKLDGSASDVANESYNGGAFSFAKKIYSKTWMEGNKRYVLFSFTKKEGFEARGFINPDGSEVDGRWIPMFYGTIVNGVAKSVATGNCITGANITTDAQHDAVVAFDSDAMFFGGSFVEVLNDLMIMFAKNTNSQASYGYGNSSGYNSSLANNGMLDNAVVGGGQFYGTSDAHSLNKIFHSIVLGTYNSWMRDPYEVVRYGEVMVSKDYTYDPTGNTYDDSGVSSPNQSAGWKYPVRYIDVPGYGALPDVASLSTSTSLARADGDYVPSNQSSLVVVCLRFGTCADGVTDGSSARSWSVPAAHTVWNIGFALLLSKSAAA